MTQGTLFAQTPINHVRLAGWRPDAIPELRGERLMRLDAETDGLEWWAGRRAIGWAYFFPESGRKGYLPTRHPGGGNLQVEAVNDWLRSLRGVHIDNANTKFDIHIARQDGVDLIEQGCTFGDVQHKAALLDDHRMRFALDLLAKDFLGDGEGKVKLPAGEIKDMPAWVVGPYATHDVVLVDRLCNVMQPRLQDEDLLECLALEEAIIPVVVEMEMNGTYLDMDLLAQWLERCHDQMRDIQWRIYKQTGVMISSPDSSKDIKKLFDRLKLPITKFTATGQPSFTGEVLREVDHPAIKDLRTFGQLSDLDSKYLTKYSEGVRADGWLRFNLHQLRGGGDGMDRGTVSGRFSAAGDKFGGYNPQQVVAVEKQLERGWCPDFVIRKLFKPRHGMWFAADAKQIEYRLFAHYANSDKINAAYAADPDADFHAIVQQLLHTVNASLNRKLSKNINFAKLYGAGKTKFAAMLSGTDVYNVTEAQIAAASVVNATYNRMFPEVQQLLRLASRTAETRGFVRDIVGRRARLVDRFHSALNRIIQGGAASINKRVIVEVFKMRRELGLTMRLTVHDELCGDLADPGMKSRVEEILNTQYFDLRVPILWDAKIGDSWAACK